MLTTIHMSIRPEGFLDLDKILLNLHGLSPDHASNFPLILNLDTEAITPQFHGVFEDWLATVTTSVDDLTDFYPTA